MCKIRFDIKKEVLQIEVKNYKFPERASEAISNRLREVLNL